MASREHARRFHFLREIASGGFGSVFLTKVMHADGFSRLVAVKVLKSQWSDNEEVARRMRDEARLLGLLRHRNIVEVMDMTSIDGRAAVVMEYLEAVDFRSIVGELERSEERMPVKAALEVGAAVASALDAAYNRPPIPGEKPLRVIHRDIKPSNLMLDDTGLVKVLDFGVARSDLANRESHTQELQFGSVDYMAPERLFFEPETPASDVYSLGASIFELLAREPFGKAQGRPEKHAAYVADRLSFLRAGVGVSGAAGAELDKLLRGALAFNYEERPTAAEFHQRARALGRLMDDEDLASWAERVVPPLLKAQQALVAEENPLQDQVLREDTRALSGEAAAAMLQDPSGLGDALRHGALAELEDSDAFAMGDAPVVAAPEPAPVDEWDDGPTNAGRGVRVTRPDLGRDASKAETAAPGRADPLRVAPVVAISKGGVVEPESKPELARPRARPAGPAPKIELVSEGRGEEPTHRPAPRPASPRPAAEPSAPAASAADLPAAAGDSALDAAPAASVPATTVSAVSSVSLAAPSAGAPAAAAASSAAASSAAASSAAPSSGAASSAAPSSAAPSSAAPSSAAASSAAPSSAAPPSAGPTAPVPDAAGLGALDVTRAARPSTPAVQGPVHEGPLPPLPSPPGVAAVVLRPLQLATPVGAPLPVVAPPAAGLGLAAPASVVLVSESDLSSDPLGDLPLSPATGAPKGPAPRAAVPTVPDGPAFDATDVPSNTVPVEALIPAAERQPARAAWAPYEEDDSPTQMQPVEEVVQGGREDTEVDVVPAAQVEDDDDLVIDGPPLTAPTAPHAVPAAPSLSPPAPPTPAAPAARPAAKGGAGTKIAALAALGCFGLLALGAVASGGLYLWSGRSAAPSAAVADAPAGGGAAALAADEPEDGEAPAPDAAAGDPAPSAAMARFSVAADAPFAAEVKSVDVSCDNKAQSKGEAAAEVDPGGATTCTVKVMLKDRSRKVVKVSGPAAGDWSCFPAGEPRCTQ